MPNMKNLHSMLESPRIKEALESIAQLLINLVGKNRAEWLEDLKKFLRKELIVIRHDSLFDPNWRVEKETPQLFRLERDIGSAEIKREILKQRLRIGTLEEAISFMGLKDRKELCLIVFSLYGPDRIPCCTLFSKKENSFQMSVMHDCETSIWAAGNNILVFSQNRRSIAELVTSWRNKQKSWELPRGR